MHSPVSNIRTALSSRLLRHLLIVLSVALLMSSCHSSKIVSKGTDNSMLDNKKSLVAALKQAEQNNAVKTYLTKSSSAKLTQGNNTYSLKVQLFMDYMRQTNIVARLPFPPIVIGEMELTESQVKVRSKTLNFNQESSTLPMNANEYVNPAIIGRVPQFYKLFGMKDFSSFDIFITDDNLYCLSFKNADIGVQLLVTKNFLLSEYTISSRGYTLHQANSDFQTVDGLYLPTTLSFDLMSDNNAANGSAVFSLSKIVINGSEKLSY